MLVDMINTLHANVDRFFRVEWREAGLRDSWIEDHIAIVDAIEASDLNRALTFVEDHMRLAASRIENLLIS